MRNAVLAPLLLLAACSRAPDDSECRLVGRWQPERPNSTGVGVTVDDDQFQAYFFFADGRFESPKAWMLSTFHPDHWELREERPNVIVATMVCTNGVNTATFRDTFRFDGPDRMRTEESPNDWYVRVPPSK